VTSGKKASPSEPRQPKTGVPDKVLHSETHAGEDDQFDARCYRPLHVTVQLDVCDIQAHLVKVKCRGFLFRSTVTLLFEILLYLGP